ncbi:unnamed protein product [Clonostachys solani]|uniref:Uncharacterized protein n=1 Tax=Clonostachys solani TaxID=160281 RepID=A0A9P0ERI9_9HYPO|nr:unnamed protein product [Clonostachys solani]
MGESKQLLWHKKKGIKTSENQECVQSCLSLINWFSSSEMRPKAKKSGSLCEGFSLQIADARGALELDGN